MAFQPSQDAADLCQSLLDHDFIRLLRQQAFAFLHHIVWYRPGPLSADFKQKADCFGDNQ